MTPVPPAARQHLLSPGRALLLAVVAAAAIGLGAGVPALAGSGWAAVAGVVGDLEGWWLLPIAAVWWAGLCVHSVVLTSSLPGLTARRALGLNLAGSAVANVVPLGGALSVGLTSAMVTSWGFGAPALAASLTVSAVWNLLVRLAVGVTALTWLALSRPGDAAGSVTAWVAVVAAVGCIAPLALSTSARGCARLGTVVGAVVDRLQVLAGRRTAARRRRYAAAALRVRRQVITVVRRSWRRMSVAMLVYLLLLGVLLDLCLHALGSPAPVLLVLAAVGVERLVTAVPVTPGGVGVAELSLVACLTVGGVPTTVAVAAALLYRFFTFFVEIPVGTVVALGWAWRRPRGRLSRPPVGLA